MVVLIILTGCMPRDLSEIPSYSRNNFLQAVIEVPAGTNLMVSYCLLSHRFRVEMDEGKERRVGYLPYPANFGFIPSTRLENRPEDSGDLIDVMVISEELHVGSLLEIIPLGMLIIRDDFHTDYMLLAIPADTEQQVVHALTFEELRLDYPALVENIESWIIHSQIYENPMVLGWEDEHVTNQFIARWLVKDDTKFGSEVKK